MAVYYDNTSLKAKHERKKSLEDLTKENKELKTRLQATEDDLTNTRWPSRKSMSYWQEVERMAKVYAALIRKGLKTLEDVPANLRDAVAKLLEEDTNV